MESTRRALKFLWPALVVALLNLFSPPSRVTGVAVLVFILTVGGVILYYIDEAKYDRENHDG